MATRGHGVVLLWETQRLQCCLGSQGSGHVKQVFLAGRL